MNFDLLSGIELTASAAVVVAAFTMWFARTSAQRALIVTALALWFAAVLWAGTTGFLGNQKGLGTPGLGAAVLLPILILSLLGLGSKLGRARLRQIPLPSLIGIHAIRVLGISFILLYSAGRLPAPFAPAAGWGDIAIGLLALPIALWASRGPTLIWNALGLLDLVTAIGLGATSAPGPIRLFFEQPGSGLMTTLPWILIPCFLVPMLAFLHLATFYKLHHEQEPARTSCATRALDPVGM